VVDDFKKVSVISMRELKKEEKINSK